MPCSKRCVAKLWRSLWGATRLGISGICAAAWQARVSWRVDIGLTGSRPGNSQASTSSALRPSDPVPVAQKVEQHRGEHRLAILAALALLDAQHHPLRVDIGDLERNDLGDTQSGAIGDAQRRLVFDARRRLQKARNLLGAQNNRHLARFMEGRQRLWGGCAVGGDGGKETP